MYIVFINSLQLILGGGSIQVSLGDRGTVLSLGVEGEEAYQEMHRSVLLHSCLQDYFASVRLHIRFLDTSLWEI